jgi:hypothetical protein
VEAGGDFDVYTRLDRGAGPDRLGYGNGRRLGVRQARNLTAFACGFGASGSAFAFGFGAASPAFGFGVASPGCGFGWASQAKRRQDRYPGRQKS